MISIGEALRAHLGVGPGFDTLRILLSVGVLLAHSILVLYGAQIYDDGPWRFPLATVVPMFFALSGFLVTGSAQRLRLGQFVLNRAFRIIPALAVEIIVSVTVIGPVFTTWELGAYVRDGAVLRYLRNVVGLVHYTLPGVFHDNPFPDVVNGSLWTVPFEIGCYVVMCAVIVSGLLRRKAMLAVALALACAVIMAGGAPVEGASGVIGHALAHFVGARGAYLYVAFVGGALCFLYRDSIPADWRLFCAAIAFCIACPLLAPAWLSEGSQLLVCLPALTYAVAFLGTRTMPPLPFYRGGDYSYGMYLYGFPVQQSLVAVLPGRLGFATHFALSLVLATAIAAVSWHLIEKPLLRLRPKFNPGSRRSRRPVLAAGSADGTGRDDRDGGRLRL